MMAKLVIPFNTSITDLLSKAPESPPFLQLRNSINFLKINDCLDKWEDMTDLGLFCANIPIEIKYSKMILYALALKCLDPILIIISTISVDDPCKFKIFSK